MSCDSCTECGKCKPRVKIKDVSIIHIGDVMRLHGFVESYPEGRGAGTALSGEWVMTSSVVKMVGTNEVETLNTIYVVENWLS